LVRFRQGPLKVSKMNIIEQNIDGLSELESNHSNVYEFGKVCRSFLKQDVYINRNFPTDYDLALEVKRVIKENQK
jgi:hypothetical protein